MTEIFKRNSCEEGSSDQAGEQASQQQERNNELRIRQFNDLLGGYERSPRGRIRWIEHAQAASLQGLTAAQKGESRDLIEWALKMRRLFTGKAWRFDDKGRILEEDWSWMFVTVGSPRRITQFTDLGAEVFGYYQQGLDKAFANWFDHGAVPDLAPSYRPLWPDTRMYIEYFYVLDTIVANWQGAGLPLEVPEGYP